MKNHNYLSHDFKNVFECYQNNQLIFYWSLSWFMMQRIFYSVEALLLYCADLWYWDIMGDKMVKKVGLLLLAAGFETIVCLLIQLLWGGYWSVFSCGIFLGIAHVFSMHICTSEKMLWIWRISAIMISAVFVLFIPKVTVNNFNIGFLLCFAFLWSIWMPFCTGLFQLCGVCNVFF